MEMIRRYFNGFGELSSENMDQLLSYCQEGSLSKRQKLIRSHQTVDSIYFIIDGFLHYYMHNDLGDKITLKIVGPNACWTVIDSFYDEKPTYDECQALGDVRFCQIKRGDFLKLKEENMVLARFIHTVTEQILSAKMLEVKKQMSMSVEERYLDLLVSNPKMVQEVPIGILASFIGTSRETLHRIRRRLTAA